MSKSICTVVLKNPTDEVRGKLRKYLNEIKPNVFTGTLTVGVRNALWLQIEKTDTKAYLIATDNSEQGYMYKTTEEEETVIKEFDGLHFPSHKKPSLNKDHVYAKAKPGKKLREHMLETGMVAKALLANGRGAEAIRVMAKRYSVEKSALESAIAFLAAIHDIGKAHPGFQKKILSDDPELITTLSLLKEKGLITEKDEDIRHEEYSRDLLEEYLQNMRGASKIGKEEAALVSDILSYHHQGKSKSIADRVKCEDRSGKRWEDWERIQEELFKEMYTNWSSVSVITSILADPGTSGVNGLVYFILSVIVTSDWIVSGDMWKNYLETHGDMESAAECFVTENALLHNPLKDVLKGISWNDVFDYKKNELQEKISKIELDKASLILVEYPCGGGKTEAALLLAALAAENKSGIYIAAPTTSTAKGLLEPKRIPEYAKRAGIDCNIPELDGSMVWSDKEMHKIPKEMWVNKKAHQFLYPFAVGTVDQLLKTIQHYRYSCIGMLGLSDKAVIIDEVHAYDAYMKKEIETLIKWCRYYEVPVILLSATLNTRTKQRLFKCAAGKNKKDDFKISKGYPLVSVIRNRKLEEYPVSCEEKIFPAKIVRENDAEEYMYQQAIAHEKGCLCLITATVDGAFSLFDRICSTVKDDSVIIFQGRDTVVQKTEKTDYLVAILGKERERRPEKLIVVATSIVEQSLNIDFDRIITAPAPVDLLIQRLGRLWRHPDKGTIREYCKIKDPFVIVFPKDEEGLKKIKIYDENILIKTMDVLQDCTEINTIKDVREMIDTVYDSDSLKDMESENNAGLVCLDSPFTSGSTILKRRQDKYQEFDDPTPKTREEKYKTVQVAILEKEPSADCNYSEARKIMLENVVSVAEYKVEDLYFREWKNDIKWLSDVKVFIGGSDLKIEGAGKYMQLTKDGLRIG